MCGVHESILDIITSRRSIRKYTNEPVEDRLIEQLLLAGMYAPSSGNKQPWHFIVIDDKELMNNITKVHPHAQMLEQAQCCIVVCADTGIQPIEGLFAQDCAAAIQNMLLTAHSLNLGAVWLGMYPRAERMTGIKELIGLPDNIIPVGGVAIGWPDEHHHVQSRYNPERVHRNSW